MASNEGNAEDRSWQLYSEAATSLTRLYHHGAQQRRESYAAGHKAALETVLHHVASHASGGPESTVKVGPLMNLIAAQMQRCPCPTDEREKAESMTITTAAAGDRGHLLEGSGSVHARLSPQSLADGSGSAADRNSRHPCVLSNPPRSGAWAGRSQDRADDGSHAFPRAGTIVPGHKRSTLDLMATDEPVHAPALGACGDERLLMTTGPFAAHWPEPWPKRNRH